MIVNPENFEHAYRQLLTITYQKDPEHDPSFTSGFWYEEEGYKRIFWEEATKAMELASWESHKNDPMYIVKRAIQPFGVKMMDSSRQQNLVSTENFNKAFEIFSGKPKETASVLYDVFFGKDDRAAFDRLAKLLSQKAMNDPLSVASLYFFLKDPDKYVTARKQGTGDRLIRLGLNASCVQKCTWEGYQQYLGIIQDIHTLLRSYHPSATFPDAQSFLWMLWMVGRDTPEYKGDSPKEKGKERTKSSENIAENRSDPFETVVPVETFTEGRKAEVYTTKYERDPRVRKQFLDSQQKPWKCEVCGMDFESVYGEIGKGVIEVHHKKPLYIDGVEQEIKPTAKYLACLCANCHRMIHRRPDRIMTVEELRKIVEGNR